jgi:tetratricopeptide (TPR) repeat protein
MNRLRAVLGAVLIACVGVGAGAALASVAGGAAEVKPPATREEAQQLLRRGWELRGQGRYEEAIAALEMAYKWDPQLTLEWWVGRENRDGPWEHYFLAADGELAHAYLDSGRAGSDAPLLERARVLFEARLERHPEGDALIADVRTCRGLLARIQSQEKLSALAPLVLVNGRYVKWSSAARVRDGRILVPAGELAEALGLTYETAADGRVVNIRSSRLITLTAESKVAGIDGKDSPLDAAPALRQGRLWVPVRFIAEACGGSVIWDANARVVSLILPPPTA